MRRFSFLVAGVLILLANGVFSAEQTPISLAAINPFAPPAEHLVRDNRSSSLERENNRAWLLKGIMLAGDASQADIDGQLIGIGETVRGFTLVAIEPRKVVLHKEGVTKVVSLDDQEDHWDG